MKRFLQLFLFLAFSLVGMGQADWMLKKERDDIVILTRESEDNPLKEYRAIATIESSIEVVYNFLTDLEKRPDWVINCLGLEILDTSDEGLIAYHTSYDIPWPLADRDLVVQAGFSFNAETGQAHLLTCQAEIKYPLAEGIIRIPEYREEVFLERITPGRTRFRAEGFVDPGGTVPPWIVNMFLVNGIYDSVIRTRERVSGSGAKKQIP